MDPPPISVPFNTISYAFARTAPGFVSISSRSSSIGMVNGWCIATKRPCSSEYSNNGNSVTQRNLKSSFFNRSSCLASSRRRFPSTSNTTLSLSAANNNRSPGFPSIAFTRALNSSSVMNLAKEDL